MEKSQFEGLLLVSIDALDRVMNYLGDRPLKEVSDLYNEVATSVNREMGKLGNCEKIVEHAKLKIEAQDERISQLEDELAKFVHVPPSDDYPPVAE